MAKEFIFTSSRLGFRGWLATDIPLLAAINADAAVMEFFPATKTYTETEFFVHRMQQQLADKGYTYFAADKLDTSEFIGFIGLSYQTFTVGFTPCTDIGWRLGKGHWGHGYATEGARRCLQYAFKQLALPKVVAIAPVINTRSITIMEKTGMQKVMNFQHPLLINDDRLRECVLYEIHNFT